MKLSTRATYGLQAMMAIAREAAQGPVMVKTIAARHHLPATYLEQVMVPLRKSGLLSATRGAKGGYRLARPARDITVCEIVEALEGPLELVDSTDNSCFGIQPELCAAKDVLDEAGAAMRSVLVKVTLAELLDRQLAKEAADAAVMYMI